METIDIRPTTSWPRALFWAIVVPGMVILLLYALSAAFGDDCGGG